MRHYSFIVLATLILVIVTNHSYAKNTDAKKTTPAVQVIPDAASSHSEEMPLPSSPATRHEEHGRKIPVPKSEELPHIHHFHKERVRKSQRHHKKYWLLSKVILILCHLAILVIAYLHVTPH